MSSTELEIRVTAELREIRAALTQLTGQIDQVNTKAQRASNGGRALASSLNQSAAAGRNAATAATQLQAGIAGAVSQARLLVASIGVLGAARMLVQYADTATRLRGQLTLATKSQEEFTRAQAETFAVAQRTRQSLEATVGTFARIQRAGRTNLQQTLGLTESINQAVALSFTTAQAGEAALFQLGQGLASGTLRGEELNSVLEQTPRLAEAIAQGLVKLGQIKAPEQLRKFASDGKLTSDLVVQAIQTQQAALREEFSKLPPTVADAFTVLKNAAIQFVGDVDSANGASRQLADAILLLANNLKLVAGVLLTATKLWAGWYIAFRLVPAAVTMAATAFTALRASIALATPAMRAFQAQAIAMTAALSGGTVAANAFSLSMTGTALAGSSAATKLKAAGSIAFSAWAGWELGTYLSREFAVVEQGGIALAGGLTKAASVIKNTFLLAFGTIKAGALTMFNEVNTRIADFYSGLARLQRSVPLIGDKMADASDRMAASMRGMNVETETVGEAWGRLAGQLNADLAQIDSDYFDLWENARLAREQVEGTDTAVDGTGGNTAKGVKAITDQFKLMKDAAERALVVLEQRYEDFQVSTREYYAERIRLQQASIDADLAEARAAAAAATTAEARKTALTQVVLLERQRVRVAIDGSRERLKAEEDITRQLTNAQIRLWAATGDTAKASLATLEEEFREFKARLSADGNTAGVALVNRLIDTEALKARLDEVDQRVQETVQRFQNVETATGAQVDAGMLGQNDGERRVQQQRQLTINQLTEMRQKYVEIAEAARLANDVMSERRALDSLKEIDGQIASIAVNTESLGYKAKEALTGAMTQLFTDLASGTKSAGDALRDFVRNFATAMAQIAANALATYLVLQLLDAIYPGLGKMTAAVSGAAAQHSGGLAGQTYQRREVPAWLWSAAPRYHTGGIAGLAPNEVPTILEKGEEVLTRKDPRHRLNGGMDGGTGGGDAGTRVVIVDDERAALKWLDSPQGERIVVKHMQRNQLMRANR